MSPDMDWGKALSKDAGGQEGAALTDGGALIGRVLEAQGVEYVFAIHGGHIWPILAALRENGIKMIHMRHEQACAFAADGYARSTGKVGVCSVTAGCGLTNAVTGLCLAGLTGSAVVCIAGQHPTTEDHLGSFQEAYGSDICSSFCKSVKRVLDWSNIEVDLRQAFREAQTAPQGPALVEVPTNILYHRDDASRQRRGAAVYGSEALRAQAEPAAVERALEILHKAERALIAAGDGVFWSGAGPELCAFAEFTRTPTYARRAAQGAIPEDHPLAVRGAWKKALTGRADVVLAVGFKFWSGEHFGRAPTWSDEATYIQIDATPGSIGRHVAVGVPVVGDPKLVLRQLLEAAKALRLDFPADSQWLREVAEARAKFEQMLDERERLTHANVPVHPDRLARDLCRVMDRDATLIIDSFTMSGWMTQWFTAHFPGQVIDAGPLAPVGHGIGMAIGAQLARPGKQVVVVIGDGGLGIGGWDIETALRNGLPIHTVLWNNSSWGPSFEEMPHLEGRTDPFSMIEGIRYDQMFSVLGCHTEHVTRPDELVAALERAFGAGKASVVNVVGDKRIGHPRLGANLLGSTQL